MAPTGRNWWLNTSLTWTTRTGASSGRVLVGMGWDSMLLGLAIYLGTGESIDPSFGQRWIVTEDGRRFLALSGEEWYAANVACGVDPATARVLTDRCIKAYLGEE